MYLQVRTDNHIHNSEGLEADVRSHVEPLLFPRFEGRIRRVEVYFQDMNSREKEGIDTRCAIEVHIPGHQAIAVEDRAESVLSSLHGALGKLEHVLDKTFGRLGDKGQRVSMSGETT